MVCFVATRETMCLVGYRMLRKIPPTLTSYSVQLELCLAVFNNTVVYSTCFWY